MNVYYIIGLIGIMSAILIIGISIPLVLRKIKMNYLYGIRIQKSFESEDYWYKINEYGGRQMIIWSIPILLVGIFSVLVPRVYLIDPLIVIFLCVGTLIICMIIALIKILRYAQTL